MVLEQLAGYALGIVNGLSATGGPELGIIAHISSVNHELQNLDELSIFSCPGRLDSSKLVCHRIVMRLCRGSGVVI